MKVLIYGAGSVGLGIASFLLKSRAKVDLVARENTVGELKEHGLIRKGIFGEYHAEPADFRCFASLKELSEQVYDYILVSTKSSDSRLAAEDLSKYDILKDKTTKIVLCQNGWGNAEIFTSFFPEDQIYNARVITGFCRPRPNEVLITVHAEAIHLGSLFGSDLCDMEQLCQGILEGGIPCEITGDIEKDLWAKMLYNCALNPLGAILDVPYGMLAEKQPGREIMDNIIQEVYKVLKAAGLKTHWQEPEGFIKVFYDKLVPSTADHRSSTLQDIQAKKKTEIEALNGAVLRLAQEHNIDVPYNKSIYNIIKFIESENLEKQ